MAGLTVAGAPMSNVQTSTAELLISICKQHNASTIVTQSIIACAILESGMGDDPSSNGSYTGVLQGPVDPFLAMGNGSVTQTTAEAVAYLTGGPGFRNAIEISPPFTDPANLAAVVNQPDVGGQPIVLNGTSLDLKYGQYAGETIGGQTGQGAMNIVIGEAVAIVRGHGGVGTAGTVTTSGATKSSTTAPFYVGGPSSPSEDVWTALNRLAQERYWYLFSDGETLYLSDGATIMQQTPAMTLDRWNDLDRITHLDFTWDNTAFQFVADHTRKKRIVRKTQLTKISSPVEATLDVICDIDEVRAGDVVALSGCGPGDGKWLVGDCRRSIFQVYSELTLIPAIQALTESQAVGGVNTTSNADVPGAAASNSGAGTKMSAMISEAATIAGSNNRHTPYVNHGGWKAAGTADQGKPGLGYDGKKKGFDAVGAVAAVLAAGGLITGSVPGAQEIITNLTQQNFLESGEGSGNPELTVFMNSKYFYLRINGQYWGADDGGGLSPKIATLTGTGSGQLQLIPAGAAVVSTLSQKTGGSWLNNPQGTGSIQAYHVPSNVLGDFSSVTSATAAAGAKNAGYVNPFQSMTLTNHSRIDQGVDYVWTDGDQYLAIGNATINSPQFSFGEGGSGWPGDGGADGGGGWICYTLNDGPYQGHQVYYAEGVQPIVAPGTTVVAGQPIATYVANSSACECGWYSGSGTRPLAQLYGGHGGSGAPSTTAGMSFDRLIRSLNGPSGNFQGGPIGTALPASYP